MSGGFGRLASNDSAELTRFDTYALGYAGLVIAEVGILTNVITIGLLSCSLLTDMHLYLGNYRMPGPVTSRFCMRGKKNKPRVPEITLCNMASLTKAHEKYKRIFV